MNGNLSKENGNAPCIETIFEQDSILGEIRNHASEKVSLSEAINDYTNQLESLDFSDCPENFTASFENHIVAWRRLIKISGKYPLMRGELHDLFSELEKSTDSMEFKALVKDIWDTWEVVMENSR